tara:strand:- start:591 stop:1298 length:708 start_codon:yes stop_codon:yes gene_type:complete
MIKIKKIIKCIQNLRYIDLYFSGVSPLFELESHLKKIKKLSTVIDIGSNKGQFLLISKKLFPKIKIFSFEPLIEELKIQKKILGTKNINYFNLALGNKKQKFKINVLNRKDSSSILKPISNPNLNLVIETSNEIKMDKLDNILNKCNISQPSLIKIDVQGYELETLKGSNKILKKTNYIIVEVSYIKTYEKQVMAKDLIRFLQKKGFSIIYKSNINRINGKIYQEDVLLKNKMFK